MRNYPSILLICLSSLAPSGCKESPRPVKHEELTLWHTFNRDETVVLNRLVSAIGPEKGWRIRSTVTPFAHAQTVFARGLAACGVDAPDVLRVELPWIARFAESGWLRPVPKGLFKSGDLLPTVRRAARYKGKRWAVPASVDGLALLFNRTLVPEPPRTLKELVALGKRLTRDRSGRRAVDPGFNPKEAVRWGFYVRADGYWFLPFLWAHGGRMLDPQSRRIFINDAKAIEALTFYRDLARLHHLAPPHLRLSNDYEDQLRRFGRGEIAMTVNGPWATAAILKAPAFRNAKHLGVASFPRGPSEQVAAPTSGHGYVVSACSKRPKLAWQLVQRLTNKRAQVLFAAEVGLLPSLGVAYDDPQVKGKPSIGAFRLALEAARDRPKHPIMSRIFDDFSPAVQSVLLGEATPAEALAGVARSWRRLFEGSKETP